MKYGGGAVASGGDGATCSRFSGASRAAGRSEEGGSRAVPAGSRNDEGGRRRGGLPTARRGAAAARGETMATGGAGWYQICTINLVINLRQLFWNRGGSIVYRAVGSRCNCLAFSRGRT